MDRPSAQPEVLSTLALKGVLGAIAPQLRARFDATKALLELIERDESADLVILTGEAIAALEKQGKLAASAPLGRSGIGVAVRLGAPKPDIGTVEALKAALLSAESVAHSKVGASGIYFAGLLRQMGIADRLKKVVIVEKGPVGAVVASGGAQIGVQQLCELAPVPGIDIVGPLPDPLQKLTLFSAGIPKAAKNPAAAHAVIDLLRSGKAAATMMKNGMQPAGR